LQRRSGGGMVCIPNLERKGVPVDFHAPKILAPC
jgi:hypothetical protein